MGTSFPFAFRGVGVISSLASSSGSVVLPRVPLLLKGDAKSPGFCVGNDGGKAMEGGASESAGGAEVASFPFPADPPTRKNQPDFIPPVLAPRARPLVGTGGVGETLRTISSNRTSSGEVDDLAEGPRDDLGARTSEGPVEDLLRLQAEKEGSSGPMLRRAQRLKLPIRVSNDGDED